MLKILNVIDSLYAGGAESLLKNFLIEAKKYQNFQIDVCTLYSRNIFKQELITNDIKLFDLGLSFKYNFLGLLKLIKIIRSDSYDIVHVHLFPADIFVAISSLFLPKRTKFIFSEHSTYNRRRSSKFFKIIDKFTYSRYQKIICVSEMVKKALIDWLPEVTSKTIVIRNATPVYDLKIKEQSNGYDVLFVGRLERAKGVDILLESIKLLKSKYRRSLKIGLVGSGSLEKKLKTTAEKLKISENVEFLGIRKDIDTLMQKSKIFVLPSRWEGLPMVILEAMASGIPIVATKVGGIPEIIEDGKDGILVEPENPEELAKAILRLLSDVNLRSLISLNAYKKVKEEYSIERYIRDLLNLYCELVNET